MRLEAGLAVEKIVKGSSMNVLESNNNSKENTPEKKDPTKSSITRKVTKMVSTMSTASKRSLRSNVNSGDEKYVEPEIEVDETPFNWKIGSFVDMPISLRV